MNYVNPYKQTSVNTASPGRLLIMLFDGLIRFIYQAQSAIAKNHTEDAHKALCKCQDIVLELRETLNREVAPELCDTLYELYSYFYRVFVDANQRKDSRGLDEILPQIEELRNAFAEAERIAAQERHATIEG